MTCWMSFSVILGVTVSFSTLPRQLRCTCYSIYTNAAMQRTNILTCIREDYIKMVLNI